MPRGALLSCVLPARDPALGLTAESAATSTHGMKVALWWWIPGMLLVIGYTFGLTYRSLPATFSVHDTDDH